nr:hypothetical protein BJQ95_02468 [Cryobacterium sp. SO1]
MSVGVGVALLALCLLLLGDAIVRGRWDVAVLALPVLVVVVWLALEVFLRPGIRLHPYGITVINPLVTTEVPWLAVTDVTTGFLVAVETVDGRRIRCWGAPAGTRPERAVAERGGRAGARGLPAGGRTPAHRVIEAHWAQYGVPGVPGVPCAVNGKAARPRRRVHWLTVTVTLAVSAAAAALSHALVGS